MSMCYTKHNSIHTSVCYLITQYIKLPFTCGQSGMHAQWSMHSLSQFYIRATRYWTKGIFWHYRALVSAWWFLFLNTTQGLGPHVAKYWTSWLSKESSDVTRTCAVHVIKPQAPSICLETDIKRVKLCQKCSKMPYLKDLNTVRKSTWKLKNLVIFSCSCWQLKTVDIFLASPSLMLLVGEQETYLKPTGRGSACFLVQGAAVFSQFVFTYLSSLWPRSDLQEAGDLVSWSQIMFCNKVIVYDVGKCFLHVQHVKHIWH